MVQDHVEEQVIERALDNEVVSDQEPKLQKVGRKRATKKHCTRIELPKLNTRDRTTRTTKDMAANIKIARHQAKAVTDLWQTMEAQRVELEQ